VDTGALAATGRALDEQQLRTFRELGRLLGEQWRERLLAEAELHEEADMSFKRTLNGLQANTAPIRGPSLPQGSS
jgi:hypothetical protein